MHVRIILKFKNQLNIEIWLIHFVIRSLGLISYLPVCINLTFFIIFVICIQLQYT